jgi:hypothetical protein
MYASAHEDPPKRRLALPLFMLLLGLSMAALAIAINRSEWGSALDSRRVARWISVPAQIRRLALKPSGQRDLYFTCTYTYVYSGHTYSSSRIGIDSEASHFGSSGNALFDRLAPAGKKGEAVPCLVNPDRPEEAVLDREVALGWMVIYSLLSAVMLLASLGVIASASWSRRARSIVSSDQSREGHSLVVRSPGRALHRAGIIGAILWFVMTGPVLVMSIERLGSEPSAGLALLATAVGLVFLFWGVRKLLQFRRFGRSHLEIESPPVRLGGCLHGKAVIRGDLTGLSEVKITFECSVFVPAKRRVTVCSVWSETLVQPCTTTFGQSETAVSFQFRIPSASSAKKVVPPESVNWLLTVTGNAQGADLAMSFPLDVFPERLDQCPSSILTESYGEQA